MGPPASSAMRSVAIENPVANISVSTTSRAPPAAGDHRRECGEVGSGSSQTMSCWTAATFTTPFSGQPGQARTASSSTSGRLQKAKRTSRWPARPRSS